MNGVIANEGMNVDKAFRLATDFWRTCPGVSIQNEMSGSHTCLVQKQISRLKTNTFKLRMLSIIANNEDDPSDAFQYELSIYPQDMFETSVMQMVANKASPADAIWDIVRDSQPESVPASNVHCVI